MGVFLSFEFMTFCGKGGHSRPLAATREKRPLAATCGHSGKAATRGHSSGCEWLQVAAFLKFKYRAECNPNEIYQTGRSICARLNIPHRAYHAESTHMVFCWLSKKKQSSGEQTRSFKNKRRGKKPRKLTSRQQARKTLNHRSQGQVNPLEPPGDPHKTWKTVRASLYLRHENQKFLVFEHGTCCKYGKQIVENMPFHQKLVSR